MAKTAGFELQQILEKNKGKKIDYILNIPGVEDLIKKEIRAYNFRVKYQKLDEPTLLYRDFKRQWKSGITKIDFEKKWLKKFGAHYLVQPPKEQYNKKRKNVSGNDIVKVKQPKVQPIDKYRKAYEEAMTEMKSRGLYPEQYIDKYKKIYEDYFDAIRQYNQLKLDKQVDIKAQLQYIRQLEKLEYNPNLIEKETVRLKNIINNPKIIEIDGKKVFEADIDTYLKSQEESNIQKEKELKEALSNILKTEDPTKLRDMYDMDYDELLQLYKDIVGDKWEKETNSLQSPEYFEKEHKTVEDIKDLFKDNDVGDILGYIMGEENLKTKTYIDNFYRAIKKDMDNGSLYSSGDMEKIEELLDLIPDNRKKWIFTDDRLELNEWYNKDPETYYEGTQGEYLIEKLGDVIKEDIKYWNIKDSEKKKILNKIKDL